MAFGATGSDQRMGRNEVTAILSDMTHGGRLVLDWISPPDLPRRDVKLVFLLILCVEQALPYGGRLTIERGDTRWALRAVASKMRLDMPLWDCLVNPNAAPEITPAQVQFLLVPDEFTRQHRRLTAEITADEIKLGF